MRVVIAGGGLVGLTLAGLLRRRGLDPVVLERMPQGGYVRRGFMMGHQGFDALAELGLLDGLHARGRPIGVTADGAAAAVAVEVGWLLNALAEPVPVRYRHTVAELVRDSTGRVTGVVAEGPDGHETIEAGLVVACDGMRSRVRGMAGLEAVFTPLAEGKIEWMSPVPEETSFAMAYLSNGSHIGMLSWPEGTFGWRMTDRVGRDAALAPGLDALVESFTRLLPQVARGVRGLPAIDEVHYDEPELLSCPRWWIPGLVLIGDAAHFFGPETGASAGIGMADAQALAQALAVQPGQADGACATYMAWRAPVVRQYEAMDPSRARLRDAAIPEAAAEERWPPAA
ncbi:MAG: FAD-dependent monooxygenase [Thermoleophilia bacterium]